MLTDGAYDVGGSAVRGLTITFASGMRTPVSHVVRALFRARPRHRYRAEELHIGGREPAQLEYRAEVAGDFGEAGVELSV
jgi:hypothetical protein